MGFSSRVMGQRKNAHGMGGVIEGGRAKVSGKIEGSGAKVSGQVLLLLMWIKSPVT